MTETLYLLGFLAVASAAMAGVIADGIAKTRIQRRAAIERAWRPKPSIATLTIRGIADTTRFREALDRLGATANETAAAMRILADAANAADTRISRRSPKEVPDA